MESNFKILLSLVVAIILGSCSYPSVPTQNLPRDAFMQVRVNLLYRNIDTPEVGWGESAGLGSGVVIHENRLNSYVLTAAHVCNDDAELFSDVSIKTIVVSNWHGETEEGHVVAIDLINDLCIIKTGRMNVSPVRISNKIPKEGERIYNLAAPYGIFGDNFILTFEGFIAGDVGNEIIYTIPTGPGSSGSPIFNKNGQLIGIIHSSSTMMETMAVGTGSFYVHKLLESIKN